MAMNSPPDRTLADWPRPAQFAAILALLVFAAFPEVVLLRETFFHRDYGPFTYPLAYYHRECFWRGELPLWSPLNYFGLPFLAQWNTITLYPGSLIYLLLPLPWSPGIYCLAHFYLAGLGMYFLARRWTGHSLAAAAAGTVFTFTGVLLHSLMWTNNIAAFGWMPWVVLMVDRGCREGGRGLLLAALLGALQMLAGAPEIILQTWLINVALVAARLWHEKETRIQIATRFTGIIALVSGLAAVQLLPFMDFLAHSQRNRGFGDSLWAMPIWGWANLFVPLFRCFPSSLGVYAQPGQGWVYSYYLGVGALFFAVLAFWKAREPRVLILGVLALFSLWMSLGDDGLLYRAARFIFPGIGFMRYPVKFMVLATFAVPLLAAFGTRWFLSAEAENAREKRRQPAWLPAAVFIVLTAVLTTLGVWFPIQEGKWTATLESGASKILWLALLACVPMALRHYAEKRHRRFVAISLLLILWLDALLNGPRPNPTVPQWVYQPGLARETLNLNPGPKVGEARLMLSLASEHGLNAAPMTNVVDGFLYTRLGMMADFNMLDDLPKVTGSYSIYFAGMERIMFLLFASSNPPPALLDFLSVSHITAPGRNIEWSPRSTQLPWITAGQQPIFADAAQTLASLSATNFNPREMVYLPPEIRPSVTATNRATTTVRQNHFTAHHVEFEVEADRPALAVISQNFYHNWHAMVNGRPVPLWHANHAFQALEVPRGHSRVTLVYRERFLSIGAAISAATLILMLALWLQPWKKGGVKNEAQP